LEREGETGEEKRPTPTNGTGKCSKLRKQKTETELGINKNIETLARLNDLP